LRQTAGAIAVVGAGPPILPERLAEAREELDRDLFETRFARATKAGGQVDFTVPHFGDFHAAEAPSWIEALS
jgi:hypothetical protein